MMSWNYTVLMFLIVFLSTIDVSKGGCDDYFRIEDLEKNLSATIPIVKTKDPKDRMECSVERALLKNTSLLKAGQLLKCFKRQTKPKNISEKCEGDPYQNVTLYHFMCLTAKALQMTAERIGHTGCEYDTVLEIYSVISKGFGQTTTMSTTTTTAPTTTLPERTTASTTTTATTTTAATTTATTTAATTTVLSPATTTTTTVFSPTTTTTTTTTTVTQSAASGITGQASQYKNEQKTSNTDTSKILLVISLALNVVLPLAVYMYMRRHRSEDYELPAVVCELNEAPADRPVEAEMEPVNRDGEEASHLMQAPECDSVVTH